MAELFKDKRVVFRKGQQGRFLQSSKNKLGVKWFELAKMLNISQRTLSDRKREKFTMPLGAAKYLSKHAGIPLPRDIMVKEPFWYTKLAAKRGGIATFQKYKHIGGDPAKRKIRWHRWWEKEGKFRPSTAFCIKKPLFSADLAEFAGIVIGDGGISEYQVTVTLNSKDDKTYCKFVSKLIKNLFGVAPRVYSDPKNSVNDLVVSRKALVQFCVEKLGLKIGNKIKQKVDIPNWVNNKKSFQIACVRGLVDTDGSVFTHTYKVHNKMYKYKKLSFTSRSQALLQSVYKILANLGMHPRLTPKIDVRLDRKEDIKEYFRRVSSHNSKHLKRLLK